MLPVDQTLLRPCGIRPLGNAGDFAGKRIELDKTLSIDLGQHRSLDLFPALLIFDEVLGSEFFAVVPATFLKTSAGEPTRRVRRFRQKRGS